VGFCDDSQWGMLVELKKCEFKLLPTQPEKVFKYFFHGLNQLVLYCLKLDVSHLKLI
jgi:hypothetical protein